MKRIILIAACSLLLVSSIYAAEKPGTKQEAEQMVKKAIAYIKQNSKEKAFAAITGKKFTDRDLYVVVYDFNGKCLAHGFNPGMVGQDLIAMRDSDGKPFVKERVEMAKKKSSFWLDYKYTNPTTRRIAPKSMYCEVFEDLIIGCGVYTK
jgi:signal transduction histidine kinase